MANNSPEKPGWLERKYYSANGFTNVRLLDSQYSLVHRRYSEMCDKAGITDKRLFRFDSPYPFIGYSLFRHAVLSSTALTLFEEKEIVAALAHEMIHAVTLHQNLLGRALILGGGGGIILASLRKDNSSQEKTTRRKFIKAIMGIGTFIAQPKLVNALDRHFEREADIRSIEFNPYPEDLISCITKLEAWGKETGNVGDLSNYDDTQTRIAKIRNAMILPGQSR